MRTIILSLLCVSCGNTVADTIPIRALEMTVIPSAISHDRVDRLPIIRLRFDGPLDMPDTDSIWLLDGAATSTLRSDALRGTLSSSNAAHVIASEMAWSASSPNVVSVRPSVPLRPDEIFTFVVTARLASQTGAPVHPDSSMLGPLIETFQVAPTRQCKTLAELVFPTRTNVPRVLSHATVAFDRPVWTDGIDAIASLVSSNVTVDADVQLGCGDDDNGYRCMTVTPQRVLDANQSYQVQLGSILGDDGVAPQAIDLQFETGDDSIARNAPQFVPISCAVEEVQRDSMCVRIDANGLVVRSQTDGMGALRVRVLDHTAESAVGVDQIAYVDHVPANLDLVVYAWTVAVDGSTNDPRVLPLLTSADTSPRFRITEIQARPRSSVAQEFVEIINDGDQPASTDGIAIATSQGSTPLPVMTLEPGSRGLIVPNSYDPRGALDRGDPPALPGTTLLQLATKIAGHGLSGHGADVWLTDRDGHMISRAPTGNALVAPRLGVSIVRTDPRMREDDVASWSYDSTGSSTPGGPDSLR